MREVPVCEQPESLNAPALSVVVPVYGTEEEFLRPCLSSIGDCLDFGIPLELIVIDDGSDSGYLPVLDAAVRECAPFAKVIHKLNGGQNSARNAGFIVAHGLYVLFCDSDDLLVPAELSRVLDAAVLHAPDVLCFNYESVGSDGEAKPSAGWRGGFRFLGSPVEALPNCSCLFRMLFRREALLASGISLIEGPRIGEDAASAAALVLRCGSVATIEASPYRYLYRPTSALNDVPRGRVLDILDALDGMLERVGEKRVENEAGLEAFCIKHVVFYGGIRAVNVAGADSAIKHDLFGWMDFRFPHWRENPAVQDFGREWGWQFRAMVAGHWRVYDVYRRVRPFAKRFLRLVRGHGR